MVINKYISNYISNFEEFSKSIQTKKVIFSNQVVIPSGNIAERVVCSEFSNTQLSLIDRILNIILHVFSKQYREAKKIIRTNLELFQKKNRDCESEKIQKLSLIKNIGEQVTTCSDKFPVGSTQKNSHIEQDNVDVVRSEPKVYVGTESKEIETDNSDDEHKPDIKAQPLEDEVQSEEEELKKSFENEFNDQDRINANPEKCTESELKNEDNPELKPLEQSTIRDALKNETLQLSRDLEAISRDTSLHRKQQQIIENAVKIFNKIYGDAKLNKYEFSSLRKTSKELNYIYLTSKKLQNEALEKIKKASKLLLEFSEARKRIMIDLEQLLKSDLLGTRKQLPIGHV